MTHIINLTSEKEEQKKNIGYKINSEEIEVIRFSMKERSIIGEKRMINFIKDIFEIVIQNNILIYLHCYYGHGRTSLIIVPLIALYYNLGFEEAMNLWKQEWQTRVDKGKYIHAYTPHKDVQTWQIKSIIYKIRNNYGCINIDRKCYIKY